MTRLHNRISLIALVLSLAQLGCAAEQGEASGDSAAVESQAMRGLHEDSAPPLPSPTLAVPDGNQLVFDFDAVGVQIYACQSIATGYAWVFQAPEARLYRHGRVVGSHFAGPTWEYRDGSKVVGSKLAAFTANPSAIPELLLQAVSHEGEGRMSNVTYIQRLETTGGVASTTGCDAAHVGDTARVAYTATYYFYKAASTGCD
jgi:hypothetical protein